MTSLETIKGVGKITAQRLSKKGLSELHDILFLLPRTYEDRSRIIPINELEPGKGAVIYARVLKKGWGGNRRFEVTVEDRTGLLKLNWFKTFPGLEQNFIPGQPLLIYGQPKYYGGCLQINHPEFEKKSDKPSENFGRIFPVYSETEGISQKLIRKVVKGALKELLPTLEEPFKDLGLPTLKEALQAIHNPTTSLVVPPASAVARLSFEELFVLQWSLLLKKKRLQTSTGYSITTSPGLFLKSLPFHATDDQLNAITEISKDMATTTPMARLLQGDVGAGKTVVAFAIAYMASQAGLQSALLAPTEILAEQHYQTALKFLAPLGIRVSLLTSKRKEDTSEKDLVIGTHAIIQDSVQFKKLGVVIVDEQHRFGVEQRNQLLQKGNEKVPHLLMMTATPIPRTLGLTAFGDLDITILRQKPAGRQPIKTQVILENQRTQAYDIIRSTLDRGDQAYVIYPLIENSDKLNLKSATEMFEKLQKEVFPNHRLALLHGRMKPDVKEYVFQEFKAGRTQLLVSTTVVEVGVDVPNATLMVIEHPERLGLSQLHQLRGRVGRGTKASQCLLIAERKATRRLRVMEKTEDGFVIAEEDLKIRGPGEFLGIRQSGLTGFKVADVMRDAGLLLKARDLAQKIAKEQPNFKIPPYWKIGIDRFLQG